MTYTSDMANYTATALATFGGVYSIDKFLSRCIARLVQQEMDVNDYMIFCTHGFYQIYSEYTHNFLNINTTDGKLNTVDLGVGEMKYKGLPLVADARVPYTDTSGGNSWVLFVPKESTKLVLGQIMPGDSKGSGGKGIFEFSGWKDMRPIQSSLAGMLTLRGVFPNKVPGRILKAYVDGDTVNTLSTS